MLGHPGDAAVSRANGGLSISLLKLGQASRDRADPAFGHLFRKQRIDRSLVGQG